MRGTKLNKSDIQIHTTTDLRDSTLLQSYSIGI